MNKLDTLLASNPLPSWRPAAWGVMVLVASVLVWAYFAQLDEVAIAPGEVIPKGQVKVIQHFEGGIIQRIHVTEGQQVSQGDPLVQLDLGASGVNREELQVQIDGLTLMRARLNAEAFGKRLKFTREIAEAVPELVRSERDAYEGRKRQLQSSLAVLREQARQRELEVEEVEAKRRALIINLELARRRLEMSRDLLTDNLVPKMEHLKLESEVQGLEGDLARLKPAIPRIRASLAEAREREREKTLKFRRQAVEELRKVELSIARNQELLAKATDQARRTEITSPVDGVVKNMRYHTIGGVVKPGEGIMEIVPSHENLVIEARISPIDVGYVRVGQAAVVKITTYDYARYGGLDGKVINIAADSDTDRENQQFFRVVVETDKSYLGSEPGLLPIAPGMQATVDIHTGAKSVMQYLLTPVLKLKHEAFRER